LIFYLNRAKLRAGVPRKICEKKRDERLKEREMDQPVIRKYAGIPAEGELQEPLSGWGTLFAWWPFLLYGPLNMLLGYPRPVPAWRTGGALEIILPVLAIVPVLVGVILGGIRKFPRWSDPYLGIALMVMVYITVPLLAGSYHASPEGQFIILTLAVWLVTGLFLLVCNFAPSLRPVYRHFRSHWTRLSFSFYPAAAILLGLPDYIADPTLSFRTLAPSVLIAAAALVVLRTRRKLPQFLAMSVGLLLAVGIQIAGGNTIWMYYGLFLAALIIFPALLDLILTLVGKEE
jgi:hypothetical protein